MKLYLKTMIESKNILMFIFLTSLVQVKSIVDYSDNTGKSYDICVSGDNCFIKQRIHVKKTIFVHLTEFRLVQSIDCPCIGDYSHQCTSNWCSKSKDACNVWKKNLVLRQIDKDTLNSIPSCNNGNVTIKTNLFNYKLRFKR